MRDRKTWSLSQRNASNIWSLFGGWQSIPYTYYMQPYRHADMVVCARQLSRLNLQFGGYGFSGHDVVRYNINAKLAASMFDRPAHPQNCHLKHGAWKAILFLLADFFFTGLYGYAGFGRYQGRIDCFCQCCHLAQDDFGGSFLKRPLVAGTTELNLDFLFPVT